MSEGLETPKIVGTAYSRPLCSLTGCGYEGEGELGLFLCSRHRKMIIREALFTQRAELLEKVRGLEPCGLVVNEADNIAYMWRDANGLYLNRSEVLAIIEGGKG
jgi:hypothetical protein